MSAYALGMERNHHLARSITDASWGSFVSMLPYKAEWNGKKVVKIDRYFPSSCLRVRQQADEGLVWQTPTRKAHRARVILVSSFPFLRVILVSKFLSFRVISVRFRVILVSKRVIFVSKSPLKRDFFIHLQLLLSKGLATLKNKQSYRFKNTAVRD